ncbi:MAG: acetate--CoA ligase family protein [Paracoccaceae bacterium]|nr:acetate--CoA ligase family protein [Paracoccaceae bacterium]
MPRSLDALFRPRSVVFVGGSNLKPALKYHRELGFAGDTWVVNPKYPELFGVPCVARVEDLPRPPDLAFVAIRREAAIDAIEALRHAGCKAVVCNAAGFAETGAAGRDLQARLSAAAGDMTLLGPNAIGLVNFADPMAAMMDHFGVRSVEQGVAICSQGGGFLCDAVFSDRGLRITHMVGGGNQALTGMEACVDYLLDDPRVTAVGLSFEALRDIGVLRRAAVKALRLGKPIVAIKFGKSEAGAQAAASHTASMAGAGAAWEALFDRLGIISTASESEFFETLKLIDSGQIPKGRRVLVTAVSGVTGVMLADHLSAAGFDLPQPTGERATRLREILPAIATPGNPQDVTMAAWNDRARQTAIYAALLDEGYDFALMVQNYPREGMWDVAEYEAQVDALGRACAGRDVAAMQLAPMVECFPAAAREHTEALGLAAMQGLEECIRALGHAVWWRGRREALMAEGLSHLSETPRLAPEPGTRLDEAAAKAMLAEAGIAVPRRRVSSPEAAGQAAADLGFPVALKALDARLLHKTEVGAVRVGLRSAAEVAEAIEKMRRDMARLAPEIALNEVLVEAMAPVAVAEIMASIRFDPSVGPVMMIAGGGIEAELWNDSTLLAAPLNRAEIARALRRLKVSERLNGWRGRPAGDREALIGMLERLAAFALSRETAEVEINPIIVGREGAWAVDAVLKVSDRQDRVA